MMFLYAVMFFGSMYVFFKLASKKNCPSFWKRMLVKFVALFVFLIGMGGILYESDKRDAKQASVRVEQQRDKENASKEAFLKLWEDVAFMTVAYDNLWNEQYEPTVNGLADGSMDRLTGYARFKELHQASNIIFNKLDDLKVPNGLQAERKEKVSNALKIYQGAVAARVNATKSLMEIVNNNNSRPSDIVAIVSQIQGSANASENLYDTMNSVGKELNLQLPSPQDVYAKRNNK